LIANSTPLGRQTETSYPAIIPICLSSNEAGALHSREGLRNGRLLDAKNVDEISLRHSGISVQLDHEEFLADVQTELRKGALHLISMRACCQAKLVSDRGARSGD
jgi:hypothetical protein